MCPLLQVMTSHPTWQVYAGHSKARVLVVKPDRMQGQKSVSVFLESNPQVMVCRPQEAPGAVACLQHAVEQDLIGRLTLSSHGALYAVGAHPCTQHAVQQGTQAE